MHHPPLLMTVSLSSTDFPPGTALNAFFRWNETKSAPDRRYRLMRSDILARPIDGAAPGIETARNELRSTIAASVDSSDPQIHGAVFAGLERLAADLDLSALVRGRVHRVTAPALGPRSILVMKLGALGDFIQALGPMAAIRRHHRHDHVTLLTTPPFAELAAASGLFDRVSVAPRSRSPGDLLALRLALRGGRYTRVYDLQTSDRSRFYRSLLFPARPEWSGHARWGSHPHANLDRDAQHTLDRQAEQLMMAGLYPTPQPTLPTIDRSVALVPDGIRLALLIPGSSPHRPEKRWPAACYGELARWLAADGCVPVVLGGAGERPLAETIRAACPAAIDLTGRTGLLDLVSLARRAALSVGNDTGVTHLVAAGGGPVRVLFSEASDPSRCAPRGSDVQVTQARELANLPIEAVLNAIRRPSG